MDFEKCFSKSPAILLKPADNDDDSSSNSQIKNLNFVQKPHPSTHIMWSVPGDKNMISVHSLETKQTSLITVEDVSESTK